MRQDIKEAIDRYVQHGIQPGDFLRAVLSNDLKGSFARADEDNRRDLFAIVGYMYNHTPSACQGSPDRVDAWIAVGGMDGVEAQRKAEAEQGDEVTP